MLYRYRYHWLRMMKKSKKILHVKNGICFWRIAISIIGDFYVRYGNGFKDVLSRAGNPPRWVEQLPIAFDFEHWEVNRIDSNRSFFPPRYQSCLLWQINDRKYTTKSCMNTIRGQNQTRQPHTHDKASKDKTRQGNTARHKTRKQNETQHATRQ